MKALANFLTTTLLLVMLATLPGTLINFRLMLNRMTESASAACSSMEASSWARAFGP